jgi:magnesium chelatase family protein
MVSRIKTIAFQGIQAVNIDVQVQMSSGLPAFTIVGLPDKAVAESKERVRSALHSIGLSLPPKRITINLSPADLQKEGSHYDLPIALGILLSMEILAPDELSRFIALGELALDGSLTPVAGVLPAALHAASQDLGLICPFACGSEAAWAQDIPILAPHNLIALTNHFKGKQVLSPPVPQVYEPAPSSLSWSDVKGQETAKRALEIAAAGGHNLLMSGPPGAGKSMLASRLSSLLPPLEAEEALELTILYSIAGYLDHGKLLRERPFRSPHHSSSLPALVGGGHKALPGEISLAHHGVLFLDELPEFSRGSLEALRQPLESKTISLARANAHITYPSNFQLIAAMNPCRCGYMGDYERACSKAPRCGKEYQSKISGPLLDRIDLHMDVPALMPSDFKASPPENDLPLKEKVKTARLIQRKRYQNHAVNFSTNSQASGKVLEETALMEKEAQTLLHTGAEKFRLSARAYYRVLKVARTIADLEQTPSIKKNHIAEAFMYRRVSF